MFHLSNKQISPEGLNNRRATPKGTPRRRQLADGHSLIGSLMVRLKYAITIEIAHQLQQLVRQAVVHIHFLGRVRLERKG